VIPKNVLRYGQLLTLIRIYVLELLKFWKNEATKELNSEMVYYFWDFLYTFHEHF